jgi:hypothetical protein
MIDLSERNVRGPSTVAHATGGRKVTALAVSAILAALALFEPAFGFHHTSVDCADGEIFARNLKPATAAALCALNDQQYLAGMFPIFIGNCLIDNAISGAQTHAILLRQTSRDILLFKSLKSGATLGIMPKSHAGFFSGQQVNAGIADGSKCLCPLDHLSGLRVARHPFPGLKKLASESYCRSRIAADVYDFNFEKNLELSVFESDRTNFSRVNLQPSSVLGLIGFPGDFYSGVGDGDGCLHIAGLGGGGFGKQLQLPFTSVPQFVGGPLQGEGKGGNCYGGQRSENSARLVKNLGNLDADKWNELIRRAVFLFGLFGYFAYWVVTRDKRSDQNNKSRASAEPK